MAKPVDKATAKWLDWWQHDLNLKNRRPHNYEKTQLKRAYRRWLKKDARAAGNLED